MTNASVYITYSGFVTATRLKVLCSQVSVSAKKNNVNKPDANINGTTEVHTQSYENLKYAVNGIHFTNETNTFQYRDLLALLRHKYTGSNKVTMEVSYGKTPDAISLYAADGTTTAIPVILETFNFPIDVTQTISGYRPVLSMTLVETK
jgi:hypothetical protein